MTYDTITKQFAGHAAVGVVCWCSIRFAIPQTLWDFYDRKNEAEPGSFSLHCPMGHGFIPAGKSKAQREAAELRDELAREKHRAEQARGDADYQRTLRAVAERRVAAGKGLLTKIKNRVGNGVCPCCNRYFANLHRHMTSQHPDWSPEMEGEAPTDPTAPRIMEPVSVERKHGDWRLSRDWKKMAARRRSLGLNLAEAARAIQLSVGSLRAYESGGGSLPAAQRYAAYLNDALKGVSPLSERRPNHLNNSTEGEST